MEGYSSKWAKGTKGFFDKRATGQGDAGVLVKLEQLDSRIEQGSVIECHSSPLYAIIGDDLGCSFFVYRVA